MFGIFSSLNYSINVLSYFPFNIGNFYSHMLHGAILPSLWPLKIPFSQYAILTSILARFLQISVVRLQTIGGLINTVG